MIKTIHMIKFIKIRDPSLKWQILSEFNPTTDCFIVSDIKTKLFVESELLTKHNFLPGFCVMRINEFYKELFYSSDLNLNLQSDSFIRELFLEFCTRCNEPWVKNLQKTTSFFKFFNAFLTVVFHNENFNLFIEWFNKKEKPIVWRSWFNLSQKFFNFLQSKKVLHESGLKALLLHYLSSQTQSSFKKERIFLDLSFSLDLCEKEIFKEFSHYKEIYILSPELENPISFDSSFNVYQMLEEELVEKYNSFFNPNFDKIQNTQISARTYFFQVKSKTQIDESKKAVIQICKWLKAGISSQDIAIFAPDMEEYWFAIRTYFEKEKIPVKKSTFTKVINFPSVRYFLSALRIHLGYFSFVDLEYFSFFKESKKDFSKFKTRYLNVPDRELVKTLLITGKSQSPYEKITGHQFIEWALSFWPKEAPKFLLNAVLKAFLKIPAEESLKASAWLHLFESELSALEVELKGEYNSGISCLSFNAFHYFKKPYVFIMGLDEESLKNFSLSILGEKERKSILNDLGFPLCLPHPKEKENSFLWFLQSSKHKELYLSFSAHNFKGEVQTTSLLYCLSKSLFSSKKTKILGTLLWDYSKKQIFNDQTPNENLIKKEVEQAVKNELQNKSQLFFHKEKIRLSPNRIKMYMECPFKYSAEKLFFIKETNPTEREISPLLKGTIVHSLFENILKNHPNLYPKQEQIEEMIEEMKPKNEKLIHKKQWTLTKDELKKLLNLFLEKERKHKNQFPLFKPKALEVEYSTYWNQKKGELSPDGDYLFTARIDRIDKDESTNNYTIRDYKTANKALTHISNWVKENKEELQLTFYAQALQKGLIKNVQAGSVSALFYSIYNDDFSAKGFVEKNSPLEGLLGKKLKGHNKEKRFLSQAINKSNERVQSLVQLMKEGEFTPKPKKKEICKKCFFRTWCRIETFDKIQRNRNGSEGGI